MSGHREGVFIIFLIEKKYSCLRSQSMRYHPLQTKLPLYLLRQKEALKVSPKMFIGVKYVIAIH